MKAIVILVILLSPLPAPAIEPQPAPEFEQRNFLLSPDIQELNVDYTLIWSDSLASLFVDPFDAVVLHVEVEGEIKDVFVISDAGQNRVAFFQCSSGESGERKIEKMRVYGGEDADGLKKPSGMATSAPGRVYDPGQDVIYLADMYNDRLLELVYTPDEEGGAIYCNRILAAGLIEYPIDVAIANYGYLRAPNPGLMVVDRGHEEDSGCLRKISLEGTCEGVWYEFPTPDYPDIRRQLRRPVSVACLPDTVEGFEAIYISEESTNSVFRLSYNGEGDPIMTWEELLELGGSYWKPGGIAFDDYGRVYVTNEVCGKIELFGPHLDCDYGSDGEPGEGEGQFKLPSNIIIDTYHGFCEALILELYGRQSGFQTFVIWNGASGSSLQLGFYPTNLVKPPMREGTSIPRFFALGEAYPNPFNSTCRIQFDIPERTHVSVELFNILGQRVATLVDEVKEPRSYAIEFSGRDLSSGVYFYQLQTERFGGSKSVILLK